MEISGDTAIIKIEWKLIENKEVIKAKFLNLLKSLKDPQSNRRIFQDQFTHISFCTSSMELEVQLEAIDKIITFLNLNKVPWKPYKVAFDHKEESGYLIIKETYVILSYIDDNGISTPKIYQLGESKKLG